MTNQHTLETLNQLTIKERIVSEDFGFFSVVFVGGSELQCCLAEHPVLWGKYQNKIIADDCGFTEGICGDVNEWAMREDGQADHILDFLLAQAKIAKVEVV